MPAQEKMKFTITTLCFLKGVITRLIVTKMNPWTKRLYLANNIAAIEIKKNEKCEIVSLTFLKGQNIIKNEKC